MININLVYTNLREHMSKRVEQDYLTTLKRIINYTEDKEFEDLNKLTSAIKYSGESDEVFYCITTLNKMKEVILLNDETIIDDKNNKSVEEYMDWLIDTRRPIKRESKTVNPLVKKEKIKSKPLKITNNEYYDWLELSMDMEITRHVSD